MSVSIYYIIETRKKGEDWKLFSYAIENKEEKGTFVQEPVFCISNWLLSSFIFTTNNDYENSISNKGLPSDISNDAKYKIQEYEYSRSKTYFSLNELENLADAVEDDFLRKYRKESILDFSVKYGKRLGYGNKEDDSNDIEHSENLDEIEDLRYLAKHLHNLKYHIQETIDEQMDTYEPYEDRIILWIE